MNTSSKILLASLIALVSVGRVHGQWGGFSLNEFGGRNSYANTYYKYYYRYANAAEARVAVTEKRAKIQNLEFLKGNGKGRLPQLEQQLRQYRNRSSDIQGELWQGYLKLKAQGAKTDLSAYDSEIAEIKHELRAKLEKYDDEIAATRALVIGTREKREIADLEIRINVLKTEKRAALEELREGRYCSKCKRPASMIQRQTGSSFQQHLGDVRGKPVPATQDMIDHVAKKYDTKIQAYLRRIVSLRDSIRRQESAKERKINSLYDRYRAAEKTANERTELLRQRKREAANRSEVDFQNRLKSAKDAINEQERNAERAIKELRADIAEIRKRDHEVEMQLIRLRSELSIAESELGSYERREVVAEQDRLREEMKSLRKQQEEHRRLQQRVAAAKRSWTRARPRTDSSRSGRADSLQTSKIRSGFDDESPRSQRDEPWISQADSPNAKRIEAARRAVEQKLEREQQASAAKLRAKKEQIESRLAKFRTAAAQIPDSLGDARASMESWMREELEEDLEPWIETEPQREFLRRQLEKHVTVPSLNPLDHLLDRGRAQVRKVSSEITDEINDTLFGLSKTAQNYRREWKKWNSGVFRNHYDTMIDAATLPKDDSFENRMNSHMDSINLNIFTLRTDAAGYVRRFGQYVDDIYADIQKEVMKGFSDDDEID